MKRIVNNDELVPGRWYWVRAKGGGRMHNGTLLEHGEFVASQVKGGTCKSIMAGMWCDPQNDQALGHYEIYGPIPTPNSGVTGAEPQAERPR